ncbi:MAG: VOC family protein [Candidatus Acidiferrum sp.]
MNSDWKPKGYSSVSVYLMSDGAQKVIDFLKKIFDASDLRHIAGPEGKIIHAEIRIDDTVVMIADAVGSHPAFPAWLHVYVSDVDATYKKALAAGGVPVQEPVRKEGDPDKRGGFKDPSGNTWWVSTQAG